MKKILVALVLVGLILCQDVFAAQSVITDVEGYACMGDDKSRKDTEQLATADAKRKAAEYAATYIRSEAHVKNFALEKDLVEAYANASVRVIQELEKQWYKDLSSGDCYKVRLNVEVVPDEMAMDSISKDKGLLNDPSAPLNVQVWTEKKEYADGDKIKVYMKGNRPFFARVVYEDATGGLMQLLPNPYRRDNYFNGGVVYEIPSGNDKFELEVAPPFGEETVAVYASSAPLGDLEVETTSSGLYRIQTKSNDIGAKTRAVKIREKREGQEQKATAFFEGKTTIKTSDKSGMPAQAQAIPREDDEDLSRGKSKKDAGLPAVPKKSEPAKAMLFDYPVNSYQPDYQKFANPNPYVDKHKHLGEDMKLAEGTPVKAIGDGRIVYYSSRDGYGELVAVIEHDLGKEHTFDLKTGDLYYDPVKKTDGVEFAVDTNNKRIDILATDKNGDMVIVELKVGRGYEKVIGQCLYYRNMIRKLFNKERVRMVIIAREVTPQLRIAVEGQPDVELFEYKLQVSLSKVL